MVKIDWNAKAGTKKLDDYADIIDAAAADHSAVWEPETLTRLAELANSDLRCFEILRATMHESKLWPKRIDAAIGKMVTALKRAQQRGERALGAHSVTPVADQPYLETLIVNDATIEKLAMIYENQPRGLLQFRDELSGLLENMERYSNGSDRTFWIEGYGGRSYAQHRVNRPTIHIKNLTISVMGAIQPDKLSRLMLRAADDGFVARFLPCWPTPADRGRPTRPPNPKAMQRAFERLRSLQMEEVEGLGYRPVDIALCDAGANLMVDVQKWQREVEATAEGLLISYIGKLPGLVLRLSLNLALLEWAFGQQKKSPTTIHVRHVEKAVVFAKDYALPMARRAYMEASVPIEIRGAHVIARMIVDEGHDLISQRDITRRGLTHLKTAAQVAMALDVLVQAGWLRFKSPIVGPDGGRGRIEYLVNPKVHHLAAA